MSFFTKTMCFLQAYRCVHNPKTLMTQSLWKRFPHYYRRSPALPLYLHFFHQTGFPHYPALSLVGLLLSSHICCPISLHHCHPLCSRLLQFIFLASHLPVCIRIQHWSTRHKTVTAAKLTANKSETRLYS